MSLTENSQMLKLKDYCEFKGLDYDTLYQGIYKSEKGNTLPSHIIKKGRSYYIDVTAMEEKKIQDKTAWTFATSYTYWWLSDWMKLTGKQIAVELAKRSKVYKSVDSWMMFLSRDLFNIPQYSIYQERRTMVQDFVVYGTAMCLAYYRDNYK